MELSLLVKLVVSFAIGASIGLEREINERKYKGTDNKPTALLGLRSFSLITALGTITGFIYQANPLLAMLIGSIFGVLAIAFYVLDSIATKDAGITTELAILYSFIIGILIALEVIPLQITLAISVVVLLLLSRKEQIKHIVSDIRQNEIQAFISFAIIALVILPFLPNRGFSLGDIPILNTLLSGFSHSLGKTGNIELINPFKLWLIVALITGVDMIGYILERTIGEKKGWLLASAAGGFVSSTATTQSLAQQSKETTKCNHLIAAAILANLVSFIQISILIAPINTHYLLVLAPTLIGIIVAAGILCIYFLRKNSKDASIKTRKKLTKGEIFTIYPALKFAGLFLTIRIMSEVALTIFGSSGFIVTSLLGALAGLDAVIINTAELAGKSISFQTAIVTFIVVNAVNLIGKVIYSYLQGKRTFALQFGISMGAIILASLIGLLFV